jgi:hypothetical protein
MIFLLLALCAETDWNPPRTDIFKYLSVHMVHVDDQHIFMLDRHDDHILVFDHAGRLVSTIAEKGQGPGQVSRLSMFLVRGDNVYVDGGRRVHIFDRKGDFIRQVIKPGGLSSVTKTNPGWVAFRGLTWSQQQAGAKVSLVAFDDEFQNERIIHAWENEPEPVGKATFSFVDPELFNPVEEFSFIYTNHDGRYALAKRKDSNTLYIVDSENNFEVTRLVLKGKPVPFNNQWGETMLEYINRHFGPPHMKADFPEFFPLIEALLISWDDRLLLWKWSAKLPPISKMADGSHVRRAPEVYDLEGHALEPRLVDRYAQRIAGKKGDWFYLIIQDEEGSYTLERCRLHDIENVARRYPIKPF